MQLNAGAIKLGFGVAFAAASGYALYQYLRLGKALHASRASSSVKPALEGMALCELIGKVSARAEAAVRLVDDACKPAAAAAGSVAVPAALVQAMLRRDLIDIEDATFAEARTTRADAEAAVAYYTAPGTSRRDVVDAVRRLRKLLGRRLLSRALALAAIDAAHKAQIAACDDVIDGALQRAGGGGGMPNPDAFNGALGEGLQKIFDRASVDACGVDAAVVMQFASTEAAGDSAFARSFAALREEQESSVMAALDAAMSARRQG